MRSLGSLLAAVLVAVVLLAASAPSQSANPAPNPTPPRSTGSGGVANGIRSPGLFRRREVPVFWLLGQSNCAGGAHGNWLSNPFTPGNRWPQLAYQPFAKIWWPGPSAMRPNSRPGWEDYRTGQGANVNNANWHLTEPNFGPEAGFADAASRALGEPVYLFKFVAVAALNPDANPSFSKLPDRESLFDEIIREWRRAAAALDAADLVPQIRGIVWIQGEYDFIANFSDTYGTHLTRFIGDLRGTIATLHQDNVPVRFVIAEMHDRHVPASFFDYGEARLRAAQQQVASTLEDVFVTDVDDLPLDFGSPAHVHFDGLGGVLLGQRLFASWSAGEGPPRR
ncbi:MAG: hypothetical protein IT457_12870 [Planctomycetes bacterium]|nr:hypothetical protein [Planctomycetota bacterium]